MNSKRKLHPHGPLCSCWMKRGKWWRKGHVGSSAAEREGQALSLRSCQPWAIHRYELFSDHKNGRTVITGFFGVRANWDRTLFPNCHALIIRLDRGGHFGLGGRRLGRTGVINPVFGV